MPDRLVQISIGSPSSLDSRDDGLVTLRVEDAMSGTVLVDLEMTPGRFWRLIQGSTRTQLAFVSSDLDRVGKKANHEELRIPREVTDKAGYSGGKEVAEPLIEAWLADNKPAHWERLPPLPAQLRLVRPRQLVHRAHR